MMLIRYVILTVMKRDLEIAALANKRRLRTVKSMAIETNFAANRG